MLEIIGARYKIVKALGRGAFGQTYIAEDIQRPNAPKCVVKQLKPMANDESTLKEARRLFIQEARILSQLGDHPQIPELLAYYQDELYLVQEFIDGNDLSQEIQKGTRLSEAAVIKLLQDILEILAFVHDQNVIHRDIKPANLIRRASDSKLVLIDFGAVKEIRGLQTNIQGQTAFTVAIGTPGYMAPEQQRGKPCKGSDIYALGMMAIQALTGISSSKLQEDSRTGKEILRQEARVSKKLAAIVDKMVRFNWSERYQSAAEVLKDLAPLTPRKLSKRGILVKVGIASVALVFGIALFPYVRAIYLFNIANRLLEQGEYSEAIIVYDQLLEILPRSEQTWVARGYALSKLNRTEEQLLSCNQALDIDPIFVEALNCRGLALHDLGRYQEAIDTYKKLLDLKPDFYDGWNNMGESLLKLKRFEKALAAFDKAILYKPDYIFAWHNRAKSLFEMKLYPEAIAAYSQTIQLDQNYHYAWLGRGNAQRFLGRYQLAISDYKIAIQINPDNPEAFYSKALAHMGLQQCKEALKALEKAIKIKPDYTAAIRKREELLPKCFL
ncbi:MAG: tetratricopeptide repeat protein [Xenococcaceae cyanobacterium]